MADQYLDAYGGDLSKMQQAAQAARQNQSTQSGQQLGSTLKTGGTILGAIVGGLTMGNPMMGAQIGGALGGAAGSLAQKQPGQGAQQGFSAANQLWEQYKKSQESAPELSYLQGSTPPVANPI